MNYNDYYLPAMISADINKGMLYSSSIIGFPVVIYRGNNGQIKAFEDVCPHRGAKLSKGRLLHGELECPYHGWRFDEAGANTMVPVKNEKVACALKQVVVIEAFGIIWLARTEKALLPDLRNQPPNLLFAGSIHAKLANALENFLEGSHTHFVHNGFVRSQDKKRQEVHARLIPNQTGFQVRYEQEPAKGMLTKLLPNRYKSLTPIATYIYPFTAILEYYNNETLVFRAETILADSEEGLNYYARTFIHIGLGSSLAALVAKPLLQKIIQQDKSILEQQNENIKNFKNLNFFSDVTDTVGKELFAWLYATEKRSYEPIDFVVYW